MGDSHEVEKTYRGHRINVDASEVRPGAWHWSYLIDGRVSGSSRRPHWIDADAALATGMRAAEARVDEIDPIAPKKTPRTGRG